MKINKLYVQDVLNKYFEVTGHEAIYNDENGIWFLEEINCIIKSWNYKFELNGGIKNPVKFRKLVRLIQELKYYDWIDFEEEDCYEVIENEKQNDEN